jgi:hypothetical protein
MARCCTKRSNVANLNSLALLTVAQHRRTHTAISPEGTSERIPASAAWLSSANTAVSAQLAPQTLDSSADRAAIRGLHSLEGRTAIQSAGGIDPWQDLRRSASDA